MDWLRANWPYLIPLFLVNLTLWTVALHDLRQRQSKWLPKWVWVPIILLVNPIGAIVYLLLGRGEVDASDTG